MSGWFFSRVPASVALLVISVLALLACTETSTDLESERPADWPVGDLVAVAVTGDVQAIVLSSDGIIHFTRDAGTVWQRAHVPALSGLARLSMLDDRVGWAVGPGAVLRTDDGGAHWRRQRLPARESDLGLSGVGAIDAARAIVVGAEGRRFRTTDGGAIWQDVSLVPEVPGEPRPGFSAIGCAHGAIGHCWLLGRGIESTRDAGQTWRDAAIDDPLGLAVIDIRFGGVELSDVDATRLTRAAAAPRDFELLWRIEAGLSRLEIERYAEDRDPSAGFDLIDARVDEVRGLLEAAGVASERIEVSGEPPWGYEDYLDDDPDFLDRYWASREWDRPGVRVDVREQLTLTAIDVEDPGGVIVAVGKAGCVYISTDLGASWRRRERPSPHDLFDVAVARERIVAIGSQGGLWLGAREAEGWTAAKYQETGTFFESLRGVDFAPSGAFGLVVGDRGKIFRSDDRGATWRLVVPLTIGHAAGEAGVAEVE